jgi:hypothetical protein
MTPGPGIYDLTIGDKSNQEKRRFTMKLSRDKVFLNGVHPEYNTKFMVPGPGFYQFKTKLTPIGTKFGTSNPPKPENMNFPGPGEYPLPATISKNGTYNVSKYKGSGAPRIPMTKADGQRAVRFSYSACRP